MSKKNKILGIDFGKISATTIALIVAAIMFLPSLIRKAKEFINKVNANADAKDTLEEIKDRENGTSDGANHIIIQRSVETIVNLSGTFNDDETAIVDEINSTWQTKEDAVWASSYFKKMKSKSLKSWLKDVLKSDMLPDFVAKGARFKDINNTIRNYIN